MYFSKRNPRRSRKLPAALADPNYINLLDNSSKQLPGEENENEEEEDEEQGEELEEDDPNK